MRISNKYLFLLLFVLVLAVLIKIARQDVPENTPTNGYVINTHQLLPQHTVDGLTDIVKDLEDKTGVEMVIVAMRLLPNNESPRAFANTLYQHMGLGKEQLDNGVLILLTQSDQEISIAVGNGLKEALPKPYLKKIQGKHMASFFKKSFWDNGLVSGVEAIAHHLEKSKLFISKESARLDGTEETYNWNRQVAVDNLPLDMSHSARKESKRYLLYLFLTLVIVNVAIHIGIRLRIAKYPIYQSNAPTSIYLYQLIMIRTALCMVILPLFPVMLYWNLKSLTRMREAKTCKHCYKHTLVEVPADASKAHTDILMEQEVILGSVMVKHFECSSCHQIESVKYPLKTENVELCPVCSNYTLKAGELQINEEPTYISKGFAQTPYTCLHCGKEFLVYDDVPKLSMEAASK